LLRINRSIQAEGVFGITKQDYSFKRFLTRGKENVATEYMLLAFAFDMNKLHYRIQSHRIGQSLFPVKDTA
ncbi:MAG: transposase, partial [Clostridiales bacterium]|nr:transposase [Clostridiales bacterium]